MTPTDFADRLDVLARGRGARVIAALAGPPGAGKSTAAEAIADRLGDRCAILPMDGFHYDDMVLVPRGDRPRKGAPHTFDVGGLATALRRLRAADEAEVAVPVFDRAIEIARAGARIIPRETPIVLVEGNWLLLDRPPWGALRPLFDLAAMIRAPEEVLRARLEARWSDLGPAEARAKVEENDLPNARLVAQASAAADVIIEGDDGP